MSRNHTHYSIVRYSNDEPPELLFYADCRTVKQARKIAAANPMSAINRWHHTPSSHKSLFDKDYRKTRGLLRLQRCYRKLRRREADAKKRVARNQRKERVARWVAIKRSFDRAYGDVARASRKVQRKLWAFWNSLDTGTGGEKL